MGDGFPKGTLSYFRAFDEVNNFYRLDSRPAAASFEVYSKFKSECWDVHSKDGRIDAATVWNWLTR